MLPVIFHTKLRLNIVKRSIFRFPVWVIYAFGAIFALSCFYVLLSSFGEFGILYSTFEKVLVLQSGFLPYGNVFFQRIFPLKVHARFSIKLEKSRKTKIIKSVKTTECHAHSQNCNAAYTHRDIMKLYHMKNQIRTVAMSSQYLTFNATVRYMRAAGFPMCGFLLVLNSYVSTSTPFWDIRVWYMSDFGLELSRILKVKSNSTFNPL